MNRMRQLIARHPLTAFFGLAYALSWWSAPLAGGQLIPHGPALAAVILLALGEGRGGLARLGRQLARWRVGWRWYLVAPGIVTAYTLGALLLNRLLGAAVVDAGRLRSVGFLAPLLLDLLLLGGMWEEPGWSGYALPRLQARWAGRPYGLVRASLVLGALRAAWHLPLLLYGHVPVFEIALALAFQVIIAWLYNRTAGSVPIVMLFHLTSNVLGGGIVGPLFAGDDHLRYYGLIVGLAYVMAFFLARAHRWSVGAPAGWPTMPAHRPRPAAPSAASRPR